MIYIILLLLCVIVECVIFIMRYKRRHKERKMMEKSLYKFLEDRVLNLSLHHRISREQAVALESQKLFLCVDFMDTKPHMLHLFSLDDCITIGRSQSNMICIRDSKASRMHCKISLIQGKLYLQDLGSANGLVIKRGIFQKIPVGPQGIIELYQDDILSIGCYRLKINTHYGREAKM